MNEKQDYEILIEICANARLLMSHPDSNKDNLFDLWEIQKYAERSASRVGASESKIRTDSLNRYSELSEEFALSNKCR